MELIKDAIADAGERAEYVFPSKDGEGPLSPLVVAKTVLRAQKVHEERPHSRFEFRIGPRTIYVERRLLISRRSAFRP